MGRGQNYIRKHDKGYIFSQTLTWGIYVCAMVNIIISMFYYGSNMFYYYLFFGAFCFITWIWMVSDD